MAGKKNIRDIRKKMSTEYDRILTSFHESGHVVSAFINLMRVNHVAIIEEKRVGGETYFDDISEKYDLSEFASTALNNKLVENNICVRYAGMAAEKINYKLLCGSSKFPKMIKDGSGDDIKDISDIIKQANLAAVGADRVKLKAKLFKKTSKQLEEHWDAVVAVAHALFKKKRINYEDLKKIIIKKTKNKMFWKNQFKLIDYYFGKNSKELSEEEVKFLTIN